MGGVRPMLIELPERLIGDRVIVRPWREEDGQGLWEAIDGSRDHLAPWMPWLQTTNTPDDSFEYVRRARAHWLLRQDLPVAIVERATGRIVGGSGLHRINWSCRLFEVGYWIARDAEGRGYVSETVQLLARMAFDKLNANRVEITMDTTNERSRRVPERLGFVLEGTLRRALPGVDGNPVDIHVFGLLPDEYRALPWATRAAADGR